MAEKKIIYRKFQRFPVIKIKIAEHPAYLNFNINGPFSAFDNFGNLLYEIQEPETSWRIKISSFEAPKFTYFVNFYSGKDAKKTDDVEKILKEKGVDVYRDVKGGTILLNDSEIINNTYFLLRSGEFESAKEAENLINLNIEGISPELVKEKIRESKCVFEIFESSLGDSAKCLNSLRIIPHYSSTKISIKNILVDSGYDWSVQIDRTFTTPVFFSADTMGRLIAVAEMGLEDYLRGVVPMEMRSDAPLESLKAQAVVSRSFVLSRLGVAHSHEGFDFCSDPHCQMWGGSDFYSQESDRAVKETEGQVLFSGTKLCDTFFTPVCGGFTRNGSINEFNAYTAKSFAELDGERKTKQGFKLNSEKKIFDWVSISPDVYCKHGNQQSPVVRHGHEKDSFRWQVNIDRKDIEKRMIDFYSIDIGTIYDIIPVKRFKSGHISQLEIIGSRKNIIVNGEQNIRKLFTKSGLYSSCFYIEANIGHNSLPLSFTIYGAGEGDGAGMCQSGAVFLGSEGKNHREILKHYFGTDTLRKLY